MDNKERKGNFVEEDIINRFVHLRKQFGPTQAKFGKKLGISDVAVSQIELGKTKINEKHIKLLCGILKVRENWLRYGEEPLFEEKPKILLQGAFLDDSKPVQMDEQAIRLFEIYEKLEAAGRKKVDECADEQWELQQLREAAAVPKDKKVTIYEMIEKFGEGEYTLSRK